MTAPDWRERAENWVEASIFHGESPVAATMPMNRAYLAGAAAMQQAVVEALLAESHLGRLDVAETIIASHIVEALMEKP